MNANAKLLAIKAAIYEMGLRFNQQPSPEKINAYAQDLMDFTPEQIRFAFREVINSGSAFFPSLAEILMRLKPKQESKEDIAPRIVEEMLKAIRDFSQYDEERMLASVSEEARMAFKMLGSTHDLRLSEEIEIVKAQLRGLVKSVISSRDANIQSRKLETIGISSPTGMAKIDFNSIAGEAISGRI